VHRDGRTSVAYAEVPRSGSTRRSPSSRESGGIGIGADGDTDDDLVASAVDAVLAASSSASAAASASSRGASLRGGAGIRRAASQEDDGELLAEVPSPSSKRGWHLLYDEHCTYLPAVRRDAGFFLESRGMGRRRSESFCAAGL
jgi:hypothetical protein